jgi:hypothetical protein
VDSLRESVIGMLLKVLRKLVTLGGRVAQPLTQESSAAGQSGQTAQPMDTDGPSEAGPSTGTGAATRISLVLPPRTGKMNGIL